ncbi:MAG: hypothetical protein AAGA56_12265, partial [Myxococcota bacterium]
MEDGDGGGGLYRLEEPISMSSLAVLLRFAESGAVTRAHRARAVRFLRGLERTTGEALLFGDRTGYFTTIRALRQACPSLVSPHALNRADAVYVVDMLREVAR